MSEQDNKAITEFLLNNTPMGQAVKAGQEFVTSGKAAIAGEAIVGAVKELPYNLTTGLNKLNDVVGLNGANKLQVKFCDNPPTSYFTPDVICQATKDYVKSREK